MSPELIKALAELAWPLLGAFVLMTLLPLLKKIIGSRAFTIKYGEIELSVQDASDQLRKQVEDLQNQVRTLMEKSGSMSPIGTRSKPADLTLAGTIPAGTNGGPFQSPQELARAAVQTLPQTILWVDDRPEKNAHEISKLKDDGWDIATVTSTSAAIAALKDRAMLPKVIISDMGRREGMVYRASAGLELLTELRAKKFDLPFVIYTNDVREKSRVALEVHGAKLVTSSPMELYTFVDGLRTQTGT